MEQTERQMEGHITSLLNDQPLQYDWVHNKAAAILVYLATVAGQAR